MNKRAIAAAGGFAVIIAAGVWLLFLRQVSSNDRGALVPTAEPVSLVASRLAPAGSELVASHVEDPVESLWVRRSPQEAARRAWRKRLERRYRRGEASRRFIDQMVAGNMVGALNALKKQALSGDPAAINVYGDFTYWNCFLHRRSPEELDRYAAMQVQESWSLPATDAQWYREAVAEEVAVDKRVVAACSEVVDVGQAFDMVDESAKQGDGANLFLSSLLADKMSEHRQMLRAAAIAGSADAQFGIAFAVLGGYQKELLGTGPDALDIGALLRESAQRIPQAEGNLAICEFYGCEGIAVDPADFEAWKLIQASVDLQCGGSWSSVQAMKATLDALSSPATTDAVRHRAEQLWSQHGPELGC